MLMRTSLRSLAGLGIMVVSGCGLVLGLDEFEDAAPAGGTTAAGTGGGPTCEPESEAKCYSGPSGTRDVGICKAGTQVCKQDGSGYEACSGEVTPAAETCASTEDEDCDGKDCVEWARLIGGAEDEMVNGVAADSAGNVYVAGNFEGAIQLGDDVLIASGERDAFLVKFSASGEYVWSRQLGDVKSETLFALSVNPQGDVVVTSMELDDDLSSMNLMLQKYDPDGGLLWRKPLGGGMCGIVPSVVAALRFLPDGDVVLVGNYCGTIRFDDDHIVSNETDREDVFVAKLRSSDGSVDEESGWVRVWDGDGAQNVRGVAVDAVGNIIVAGDFYDELVLGDSSYASAGGTDAFLVKVTNRGLVSWARVLGGPEPETLRSVAVDRLGGPVALVGFQGTVDFGGGEIVTNEHSNALLKYTTSNVYEWNQVFGDSLILGELLIEPTGDLLLVGSLTGSAELGGELLRARSARDLVLLKMGPEREPVWARNFGIAGEAGVSVSASALSGSGELLVAVDASGRIDFGAEVMMPQSDQDIFIASLRP
ncbi:SBBP repeat-containing protein [Sorangium sp. So ce388]|uniref:SBBP repeat-containing protein n=1 Tax=Sorangium sp. So ce388 TaxID=3133309 RepID=UPI003F5B9B50